MTAPRWIRDTATSRARRRTPWPQVVWAALLEQDGLLERGMVHAGDLLLRFSSGTAVSYCVPPSRVEGRRGDEERLEKEKERWRKKAIDADRCVMTADRDDRRSTPRRRRRGRSCRRRSCVSAKHYRLYALDRDDDADPSDPWY